MRAALNYLKLTKPSIMLLVLFTGATSLVLQGDFIHRPGDFVLVLVGLFLTGGSANAFNMYFERDIDSRMTRTRGKRPLPLGLIRPSDAFAFAVFLGVCGAALFTFLFNYQSALLALGTIIFYAFFYTLFLKPRTRYNIVIGGAAGSMAPVIAWTAASGQVSITSIMLSAIIFLWTPPHFWSLALHIKKDYEDVGYPMMPVAAGENYTRKLIFLYSLAVVLFSLLLYGRGAGTVYGVIALTAGAAFIYRAYALYRSHSSVAARPLFLYSIFYLFAVFASVMVDTILKY